MVNPYKVRARWVEMCPCMNDVEFVLLDSPMMSLAPTITTELVDNRAVCYVTAPQLVTYLDEEALDEWLGGVREYLEGGSDTPKVVGPAVRSSLASNEFRKRLDKKVLLFHGWSPSKQFRFSLDNRFAPQVIAVRERIPSSAKNLKGLHIYPRPCKADPTEDSPVSVSYLAGLMLVDGPALASNKELVTFVVGFYIFRMGAMQVLDTGEIAVPGLNEYLEAMPNRKTNEKMVQKLKDAGWIVPGVTV